MPLCAMPSVRTLRQPAPRVRGFTLVEMIVVIVVAAIIAATLAVFLKPTLQAYADTRVRSDLSDQADTALRRMLRDVRQAVPNSLRMPDSKCIEMVPASAGGRYRMGPDTANDSGAACSAGSNCAAYIDPSAETTVFDSLTTLSVTPSVGDWVVIDNQNVNDVYAGLNRSAITAFATSPQTTQGKHRITINALQVSNGYTGGRFVIVPNNQQAVFYVCTGVGFDSATGNGTGTLYRKKAYGFNASYPSACPAVGGSDAVIATRIKSCDFEYVANQGATQQSGYLRLELEVARNHETMHLAVGAHVLNVP